MPLPKRIPPGLLEDIFASFPEYAQYSFRCTAFHYRTFEFCFHDHETDKKYIVKRPDAVRGFKLFADAVLSGKLPGISVTAQSLYDAGSYDAYATDCLLQYCTLGAAPYG